MVVVSVLSLVLVVMWLQGQTGGGERTLTFSYGAPKERFGMWQLRNLWEEGGVFGAVPAVVGWFDGQALVGSTSATRRRQRQAQRYPARGPPTWAACVATDPLLPTRWCCRHPLLRDRR